MDKLKILNSKETKELMSRIEKQWGFKEKLDYVFLKNEKSRVFIASRDLSKIDLNKLRINTIGIYFCEVSEKVRLSIEGSQIIGPKATKNVFEVDEKSANLWLKGENLICKDIEGRNQFQIIKFGDEYLGSGRISDYIILNFVPKTRRVNIRTENVED